MLINHSAVNLLPPPEVKDVRLTLILVVSTLLIAVGLGMLSYSYYLYPYLMPSYGGGERFVLTSFNNYSKTLPLEVKEPVELSVSANDTVKLRVDGKLVRAGREITLSLEPGVYILYFTSSSPVEVEVAFRLKPLTHLTCLSLALIGLGLLMIPVYVACKRRMGK